MLKTRKQTFIFGQLNLLLYNRSVQKTHYVEFNVLFIWYQYLMKKNLGPNSSVNTIKLD